MPSHSSKAASQILRGFASILQCYSQKIFCFDTLTYITDII